MDKFSDKLSSVEIGEKQSQEDQVQSSTVGYTGWSQLYKYEARVQSNTRDARHKVTHLIFRSVFALLRALYTSKKESSFLRLGSNVMLLCRARFMIFIRSYCC